MVSCLICPAREEYSISDKREQFEYSSTHSTQVNWRLHEALNLFITTETLRSVTKNLIFWPVVSSSLEKQRDRLLALEV